MLQKLQLRHYIYVAILVILTYSYLLPTNWSRRKDPEQLAQDAAANRTLGFQKILTVAVKESWRTRGLRAAASYSDLEITIPPHPHTTDELVEAFQRLSPTEDASRHPSWGNVQCWLAHLDLVKHAVMSEWDTVLIVEDDVDWDVTVKDQMRLVSAAVRSFTRVDDSDPSPYGHSWDVLWFGHCGEHTDEKTNRFEYEDPTTPPRSNYTGWAKKYVQHLAEGHRAVQRGKNPICTFAYGLTRRGMGKILDWAGKGNHEGFDVRLMEGCKHQHLGCMVVTPEIMRHYRPPVEFGRVSVVGDSNGKGSPAEEEDFERFMGRTENIPDSARCKALFDATCVGP